ncbi:NAD(P)H dehydrogenase (quinone) [Vibrio sinaloensis DSM 21326]|uniref:NAD(P)H dehydrogenase (Quinone) n=1 Tax=Vibrio sinaloensis DSM 21326 TaxID=945550 RepID=E8MBL5_PHOS4|nr:NAD(P)H-dependent oxidoreductase [Vibrio sinaloensis]EGA68601.1 NAD(P)H dehydrogenase (quinone) [Vibrio sinaloensis DSM 21326]
MSKVVVISGHPNLESSYTNKVVLAQLQSTFSSIDIRRLDALYPDYQIDVETEQTALLDADVVVLQFPFYWYSMPALLKKWLDDVMSFNFAYGPEGDKLKGKGFIISTTIGGPAESYDPLGYNHFTVEQLLMPIQQTAYLAGMNYQKPIFTHGMVYIPGVYNTQEGVEAKAVEHAVRLSETIHYLLESPEAKVTALVKTWFEQMDKLQEDAGLFHAMLRNDVAITAPEGEFNGIAGFNDWYQVLRSTFKPNCEHVLEQIVVHEKQGEHVAEIRVRLIAETVQGEAINVLVNEEWSVDLDKDKPRIIRYKVEPV